MRLLVTGASGFIGSSLLTWLPKEYGVVALARNLMQVRQVLSRDDIQLLEGDVADKAMINRAMEGVDAVIHLGEVKGSERCKANLVEALLTNVYGTSVVFQEAKRHGVKRFVFASSYWVYGFFPGQQMPLTEEMKLCPTEVYGACKAISEYQIADSGIGFVILRLSNVYGYGSGLGNQDDVVFKFVKRAHEGLPLELQGGGKQRLDFVHVEDVCRCILQAIKSKELEGNIYNVGGGSPISVEEVARIVSTVYSSLFDRSVELHPSPVSSADCVQDRWVAIDRIRDLVGDYPMISLAEGIRQLIQNYSAIRR